MQPAIKIIHASRKAMLAITEDLSSEIINKVPANYRNNLIWHMGHVLAIQQRVYIRSGIAAPLPAEFSRKFDMGTAPGVPLKDEEINYIRRQLSEQAERFEKDHESGAFVNYEGYDSSVYPGLRIADEADAISFVAFHDGLHLGMMTCLLKSLAV